jgi:hypothetical protein
MTRSLRLLLGLLALVACAPNPSGPVKVMSMVLTSSGRYEAQQVELKTLSSLVSLDGSIATLYGGANIRIDASDPLLQSGSELTDEQLQKVFVKDHGLRPRVSLVESGGIYWPGDFHSWNLVTTYFNFEQAFAYFQGFGVPAERLAAITVYYFPTFVLTEAGQNPLTDNAIFFSPIQAFAILPFQTLQKVPLSMNSGVVAHEYSHLVFNRLVYKGLSVPDPFAKWAGYAITPQVNALKALDEGLGDYHAYGASCSGQFGCNSRFIAPSITENEADSRDFAKGTWCMSTGLRNSLNNTSVGVFSGQGLEYNVGTLIAASFHAAAGGNTARREALQKAVLSTYSDSNPSTPGLAQIISNNLSTPESITFATFLNAFLQHVVDSDLRRDLCSQFLDHLQIPRDQLPDCPASASNPSSCSVLPPG